MQYYTYITTNPALTVFYTGMTNNLSRRMKEHREAKGTKTSFAGQYYCYKLIYFEAFDKPIDAINREDEIKNLTRDKKIELIKTKNPEMIFYNVWEALRQMN